MTLTRKINITQIFIIKKARLQVCIQDIQTYTYVKYNITHKI